MGSDGTDRSVATSNLGEMGATTLTARSESELLERAREGDHRAFADLLQPYDARLRGLAFRMLGDATLMDDALQDAYVKAYKALSRFRGESSVGTWLFRIAHNSCIDLLRKRRELLPLTPDMAVADPGVDHGVAVRLDLAEALDRLSVDHRAVLVLVDALGFDYQDAADVLGVPVGTVRSRLARARRLMRRQLGDGGRA